MFKGIREVAREARHLTRVLEAHRDHGGILFYAEDTHSYIQFEGYVDALSASGHPLTYVTSADADPILTSTLRGVTPFHLNRQVPQLFSRIEADALVLTMPDVGNYHIPAPPRATMVYTFHSLNSTHTSYRGGAFDHYDVFLCTGPHHEQELAALFNRQGRQLPRLEQVGYYKLDRIIAEHGGYEKVHPRETTVVVAPSWAPGNILESCGAELIGPLAAEGFRVVVRPHPQFFHSLYPEGAGIVDRLKEAFGSNPSVVFETSIESEDSFHEADLMVSDWSGAAFEFAFGTLRTVLFVDTPQKLFNPDSDSLGLPAFEESMRTKVGEVVSPSQMDSVGDVATRLVAQTGARQTELAAVRSSAVFNVGKSAAVGAEVIASVDRPG